MEGSDNSDDSEMEYEQQEMEVALYSQIHFDSVAENEEWFNNKNYDYQKVSYPLRIGIKELPVRNTPSLKKPVFGEEFIAFSSINNEEMGGLLGPKTDSLPAKDDILMMPAVTDVKEKGPNIESVSNPDIVTSQSNESLSKIDIVKAENSENFGKTDTVTPEISKTLSKTNVTPQNNKKKNNMSSLKSKNTGSTCLLLLKCDARLVKSDMKAAISDQEEALNMNKSACDVLASVKVVLNDDHSENSDCTGEEISSLSAVNKDMNCNKKKTKQKEKVLPFIFTKADRKSNIVTEDAQANKNIKQTSSKQSGKSEQNSERSEKRKTSKPDKEDLPKLESFLKLSKNKPDPSVIKLQKKVPVSKADAAVKARKPTVCLRKRPTVLVKYQQDSDTNTEYSDSEVSTTTSPEKTRKNTLEDISQNSRLASINNHFDTATTDNERTTNDSLNEPENNNNSINEDGTESQAVTDEPQGMPEDDFVSEGEESDSSCTVDVTYDSKGEESGNVEVDEESTCVEEDNSTKEESASDNADSSNDSDSSDPMDFIGEAMPSLEFNLAETNISPSTIAVGEKWRINEKDRSYVTSNLSRYFVPRVIECRNCKKEGHLSRDCPLPLKRRCIYCAVAGHSYQECPDAICFKCGIPGHRFSECRDHRRNQDTMCDRCWMLGHKDEQCPDRWRQYHLTVNTKGMKLVTATKGVRRPLIFCYNCGKKGHLGYECKLPRMSKFTFATYPLIARYDTKNKRKEMMQNSGDFTGGPEKAEPERYDKKSKKRSHWSDNKDNYHQSKDHVRETSQKKPRHSFGEERMKSKTARPHHRHHDTSHHKHEIVEERNSGRKERKKKRSRKRKEGYKTEFQDSNCKSPSVQGGEGTIFVYTDHKSEFREEVTGDVDCLKDLEAHQVSNNEWWNNSDKPMRKRKQNKETFSNSFTGDYQIHNRSKHRNVDPAAFHGSSAHDRAHGDRGNWRNDKHQLNVPQKHGRKVTPPKYDWKHQSGSQYRSSGNNFHARLDQRWSANTSSQRRKSGPPNQNFRAGQLHHAVSWPLLPKPDTGPAFSKGGFCAHNDRFVAMKNSFDITVRLQK